MGEWRWPRIVAWLYLVIAAIGVINGLYFESFDLIVMNIILALGAVSYWRFQKGVDFDFRFLVGIGAALVGGAYAVYLWIADGEADAGLSGIYILSLGVLGLLVILLSVGIIRNKPPNLTKRERKELRKRIRAEVGTDSETGDNQEDWEFEKS